MHFGVTGYISKGNIMAIAKNYPKWMDTAKAAIGTKEIPGTKSNSVIMNWAVKVGKFLGIKYDGDHVPWCGLFAAFCMTSNGFTPPNIAVRASEWSKWGVALAKPSVGAVLTFSREGGGHVGFYVSEDPVYYHVLGGNQSDSVNVTKIDKARCTAIRWPTGYPLPTKWNVLKTFDGKVSTNEQ
jgi:uncharacterized protein (TIGR02594 family)